MKRSKRRASAGDPQAEAEPGTEQVLREALEPSESAPDTDPRATAQTGPLEQDSQTEVDDKGSTPAPERRSKSRNDRSPPALSVAGTHYHRQPDPGVQEDGWQLETEGLDASPAAESYYRLRTLLADLPIKAGAGEAAQNLEEVAMATLSYYRYGLSQPEGNQLPVGVSNGARLSIQEDIATLAGYLELEKRFNRVSQSVASEQAAGQLLAALASRALQSVPAAGDHDFVREAVRACLGAAPAISVTAPAPSDRPASGPAPAPQAPTRLVYRRRGTVTGPNS